MKHIHKHLFFDMDLTISPAREPVLPEMLKLLNSLPHDLIIVSGGTLERIDTQTKGVNVHTIGENGSHAKTLQGKELWHEPLDESHKEEIHNHIKLIVNSLDHELNPEWHPIEDRGAQITFSPIGNHAPLEIKNVYDPDRKKREKFLSDHPFESKELVVKIGGSTCLDYIHKDRHKGTGVQRFIDHMKWENKNCIYFGDGLFPGGNDEDVIGVIETILVEDHRDTYRRLKEMFV